MKRTRTHEGDVFVIELREGIYAYGQMIAKGRTSDCIVAFDYVTETVSSEVSEIVGKPVAFLYHTVDVEIVRGRWKVVGNAPVSEDIRLPEYKTETLSGFKVLSHRGEVERCADAAEVERLNYLASYSPRMLEEALKARQGMISWEPWMDEIVYKP